MQSAQRVTMLVGADRRELLWTPELAAQWTTLARHALPVLSVTPTPTPIFWVDTSQQPSVGDMVRLSVSTGTWEATCRWLTLLTADLQLAETFLCLEVTLPLAYPFVVHFPVLRQRAFLEHLARGGAFHLGLEASGQVIPLVSVGTSGLAEQLATVDAFAAHVQ